MASNVEMVRRLSAVLLVVAVLGTACDQSAVPEVIDAPAGTTSTPEPTDGTLVAPRSSTELVPSSSLPGLPESRVLTGTWVKTTFPEDRFVQDIIVAEGTFAGLLEHRSGRFRVLEVDEDGNWNAATGWIRPSMESLERIDWTELVVIDGGYVAIGFGRLEKEGDEDLYVEPRNVPVFALVDRETGDYELSIDLDRPDRGYLVDSTEFGDTLIAVGGSATAEQSWGPGIWKSVDGLVWEPVAAPSNVQEVIVNLESVAASADRVVAVGRNNFGGDPPWVLWSEDGAEWHAGLLPMVDSGEQMRLHGVAHDGSEFLIVGSTAQPGGGRAAIWRSQEGVSWERQEPLPSVFGTGEFDVNAVWGGAGVIVVSGSAMHRASSLYCYDDLDSCRKPFTALWVRLDEAWRRIVPPTDGRASYTVAAGGERFVATGSSSVSVWVPGSDGSELYASPLDTAPPATELPLVGLDQIIETDTVYAYPLHTGCFGMQVLGELNGNWWLYLEGSGGPTSPAWPVYTDDSFIPGTQIVYGTLELVAADRIEYSIPGLGVVAVYEPAPDYQERGCY